MSALDSPGPLSATHWSRLTELDGKVAIVTGGASGMGLAAVKRLVEAKAKVVVVDLDGAAANRVAESFFPGTAIGFAADVASESDTDAYVDATVEKFGRVDAFFSNAGILGQQSPLLSSTGVAWRTIMDVNLVGTYLGVRAVGRRMVEQANGGSIVVTASVAGMRSSPGSGIYGASKAGVLSLVRTASRELGPHSVRVNAICPGVTVTNFADVSDPTLRAGMTSLIPLGRLAEPDDMARVAVWLLGEGAAYVNGVVLPVDGGREA
jgi:NAD(P)-dependent dehydrogenase (short-subunit alcohol dehydrogenase family)